MSIQKATIQMTIRNITKGNFASKLNFDLAIQRNEVWDDSHRSLFIHSILYGYIAPPIYCQDEGTDILYILEGKQRIKTIQRFFNNEFKLTKVPLAQNIDISNMYYKNLPEELKDEFLSYNLSICQIKGMTEEERDEQFLRLNNGVSLTTFEAIRAVAHGKVTNFLKQVSEHEFFKKANITPKAKQGCIDEKVILQSISLMMEKNSGFSPKELRELAIELKEGELSKNIKKDITEAVDYLNNCFDEDEEGNIGKDIKKYLTKVHLPTLLYMAKIAREKNIDVLDFLDWFEEFFSNQKPDSDYLFTCKKNSSQKEQIQKRLEILKESLDNFLNEYEKKKNNI